ncbi:FAD:protein FMN transferase [Neptunicella marina]|uniref:FAD:protein FMN transferase n=1 Tax=Neptunicella marina TaxID=2125989 RepID=A0A8J6M1G0_9ALTE|nr:FAD:protein FMN transferase [Neptunicella marina]MBC3765412.1 FAD:protein FMN transferase [Neptunicella marina]
MKFKLGFTGLILSLLLLSACQPATEGVVAIEGKTMGTTYHIKWVPTDNSPSVTAMQTEIDQALVKVNKEMSTYDPNSELSVFNQSPAGEAMTVSDGTATVIKEAKRLGELTGGVLDVTVGPLVNLWGFGPQARPETIPAPDVIAEAKSRTGLKYLRIDGNQLSKSHEDLYVDLSTIAKGYGVDVVADILHAHGVESYLVEIGGEMRLAGTKPGAVEWRVAVEKPVSSERSVAQIIGVGNNAVATSGDYRNYFEQDGIRYSHIIDPTTGYPIQHNLVSVTVVHPSCMTADGLATAIDVMGYEKGLAFAEKNNLAVLLITRENDGFKSYTSKQFEPYLR